jgi:hypothetical protein
MMAWMTTPLNIPEAPACPLLGLVADPRTHYTFPHPDHRCHAESSPNTIEPGHQSAYCLAIAFIACGRYETPRRPAESGRQPASG